MWKKYKTTLILTTLISLFPMVIGLLLWNRMPDTIATHFGTNNVPNGWSSKVCDRAESADDRMRLAFLRKINSEPAERTDFDIWNVLGRFL